MSECFTSETTQEISVKFGTGEGEDNTPNL